MQNDQPSQAQSPEYRPEYARLAFHFYSLGATDSKLADAFSVSAATISNWRGRYPEFDDACRKGKDAFDNQVERGLYQRAVGYWYDKEVPIKVDGEIHYVNVLVHIPPDVKACIFWLTNRRPEEWSDKPSKRSKRVPQEPVPARMPTSEEIEEKLRREGFKLVRTEVGDGLVVKLVPIDSAQAADPAKCK
jgi:hypothetical protein